MLPSNTRLKRHILRAFVLQHAMRTMSPTHHPQHRRGRSTQNLLKDDGSGQLQRWHPAQTTKPHVIAVARTRHVAASPVTTSNCSFFVDWFALLTSPFTVARGMGNRGRTIVFVGGGVVPGSRSSPRGRFGGESARGGGGGRRQRADGPSARVQVRQQALRPALRGLRRSRRAAARRAQARPSGRRLRRRPPGARQRRPL